MSHRFLSWQGAFQRRRKPEYRSNFRLLTHEMQGKEAMTHWNHKQMNMVISTKIFTSSCHSILTSKISNESKECQLSNGV